MGKLDTQTWHVMDALADDWESIAQIQPHMQEYCELSSHERIFEILRQLHSQGLVEIMEVAGHANALLPADLYPCWFAMTPSGRALWDAEGSKYRRNDQQV